MNKVVSEFEIARSLGSETPASRKICIVTGELEGPFYNGGVGTTNRALALELRNLGHDVDILYTHVENGAPLSIRGEFSDHVESYRRSGIRLICIDNQGDRHQWQAKSYLAMRHLLRHQYDLVFFDDLFGTAYYPLLARRTGNPRLQSTAMCITTHGAMEWMTELNQISIMNFESLALMEMERRSVELADFVKAPSAYILRKYNNYGWSVIDNFIVLPNFVLDEKKTLGSKQAVEITEIVFFGRLETRKGLRLFCRALDKLKFKLKDHVVTFLGKTSFEMADLLIRKAATWPFQIRLLTNYDQTQALTYLKGTGRLAVMPSIEDNCPSAILECLQEGIPFIASSGSGGEELLDEPSKKSNLFNPSVTQLCAKLLDVLANGGRAAAASFDDRQIRHAFFEWLGTALKSPRLTKNEAPEKPLSSIPILIVIVSEDFNLQRAAIELKRAMATFNQKVHIELLTADTKKLAEALQFIELHLPVTISEFGDLATVAHGVARLEPTVLALCHISQLPSPAWIERGRKCFQTEPSISALTGMAGEQVPVALKTREPFVSTDDRGENLDRYLVGYAPPLFAITRDTNSGFLLMRSELIEQVCDLPLIDQTYARLERMEEWVHKVLVTLYKRGHRFELVPDLISPPLTEPPFEAARSDRFVRMLASGLYGHKPGSDPWLITRLAIDAGLERDRTQTNAEYRKNIARKLGQELPAAARNEESRQLAMLAHVNGQVELALELATDLAVSDKNLSALSLAERVNSDAKAVKVWDLVLNGHYQGINLDHEWSFRRREDGKEIQLHANPSNEGRATLVFDLIDLSDLSAFACKLGASEAGSPLRIRIDLILPAGNHCCSFEKVVAQRETTNWTFEIPNEARAPCKVICSVEMTDPLASNSDAYIRMFDPRFILRPEA